MDDQRFNSSPNGRDVAGAWVLCVVIAALALGLASTTSGGMPPAATVDKRQRRNSMTKQEDTIMASKTTTERTTSSHHGKVMFSMNKISFLEPRVLLFVHRIIK